MAGIFGLREVRTEQITKITGNRREYGYFAGGGNPGNVCTIDRLDFSNETVSAPGNNLTDRRQDLTAVSSPNYGYFGGGVSPSPPPSGTCLIDRLDFSNETTSNPPANLTQARTRLAAVSNSNYGYFAGGNAPGPTRVCIIDRLDFSNETVAAPGTYQLTQARPTLAAVSNSNYGYFGGGYNPFNPPSPFCTIDRLDFSNETVSAPGNNLTQAKQLLTGVSSPQYGYFAGGRNTPVTYVCTIDRLDFSNETTSNSPANLTQARSQLAGVSNPNYGYFGGGTPPFVCTIDRLDFSNETVTAPGNNLTEARYQLAGVSGPLKEYTVSPTSWPELAEFGYFGGGINPLSIRSSIIDRIDYSTETVAASGQLIQARDSSAGVSNSNYGYFGGGQIPPGYVCTIDRLDFSNETVTSPGNYQLTQARRQLAALSSPNYGYFGGGYAPPLVNTIDRLDFSNETVSAPGNNLTEVRRDMGAVSNSNYGYFAGGNYPGICTIDRLDFSNETVSAPGNNLTQKKAALAAVSNSNYGYFGGGYNNPPVPPIIYLCTIDRLDFSNETVSAPGNYQLTQGRRRLAAVSNSNYGYFGCGSNPDPVCTIDRLDFSNETVSAPGTYQLTQARSSLAAVSTKPTTQTVRKVRRGEFDASGLVYSNYGYFGGGNAVPGIVNTIDRLDFSSETTSNPPANLTEARRRSGAVSNSNYGYFGGGDAPGDVCTIDRLDFSNETVSAPGNNLTDARWSLAAVSSSNYGYFGGGTTQGFVDACTIDRLDFSNETILNPAAPLGQLTDARNGLAAVSNSNYGYFGGGGGVCTIDRLDFSNETVAAPGNYQLTQARYDLAAVSNSNYGYFAGGEAPSVPGVTCLIDRLDFSNETVDVPGTLGQLTQAREYQAAVSNSNYGYFAGGNYPGICTIDRLDFSNETVSAPGISPGQLTQARGGSAGINIPLNQTRHVAPQAVVGVSTFFFSYGKPENTVSYGFGYFGGGSSFVCTIDRLDFSSETVAAPGNYQLTQRRRGLTAVSNSNYGYFGGGYTPGNRVSTIDRLDFSNETVTGPPIHGMFLTQARDNLAAVSSPRGYGYFAGGFFPPNIYYCTIDRLDFSSETVDVPGTLEQLTQARNGLAAVSNSNYGYFGGGFAPSVPAVVCTIDRLDFYNETIQFPVTVEQLRRARLLSGAVSSPEYGYFAGGNPYNSTIDRLDFSSETVAAPGNNLTEEKDRLAGVSNSNYGYFGGGDAPGDVCTIDRLDFSNETVAAPGAYQLTQARNELAGIQVNYYQKVGRPISKAYGYFAGGIVPSVNTYNTIDRLDFSNETVLLPGNNLIGSGGRSSLAAVSNSNYGYFGGGNPYACTIDRLDFSNETVAAPGSYQLTEARANLAAVSNSNYGYFGGGNTIPGVVNTIDRLDFSSETVEAPGTYELTDGRQGLAAVSNSNYGYFGGGSSPGLVNTIDRLDFSNETIQFPITIEQLTQARYQLAAVSNSNYGYFAAGQAPSDACIIDRLDFSSETLSLPGNNLPKAKIGLAGVSNSNYGYFGGGIDPSITPPGVSCTIDRLDFSNETVSAPGNGLTQARQSPGAVSN